MRISDWSSDVCSSDLANAVRLRVISFDSCIFDDLDVTVRDRLKRRLGAGEARDAVVLDPPPAVTRMQMISEPTWIDGVTHRNHCALAHSSSNADCSDISQCNGWTAGNDDCSRPVVHREKPSMGD